MMISTVTTDSEEQSRLEYSMYVNSVTDDSEYIQDEDEYCLSMDSSLEDADTLEAQDDHFKDNGMTTVCDDEDGLQVHNEEWMSSNRTNKVIQNIDILNQGDTDHYDRKINDGKRMKLARQFMEECSVPCYNSTVKNHGIFSREIKKNKMPLPSSLYMTNLFFDNDESKEHLH